MITATRRLQFSAGHRVYGHESKCANLHGHNYVIFLHAEAPGLDSVGRVIDFSVLKEKFGKWIDDNWDHGFLYYALDQELAQAFRREELITMKTFICPFNPTAEEMAQYVLTIGPQLLAGTPVMLKKVVLWETENCFAEVTL